MTDWSEAASAGRDRWQILLDEVAEERLARRAARALSRPRGGWIAAVLAALTR